MNPKRICVIGNSGSGKSTLARLIGQRFDLPVWHLDQELLHGQFIPLSAEDQKARHDQLITGDRWVIDGGYKPLMPDRFRRTDLVIFLSVPRWRVIPRTIRRTLRPDDRIGAPDEAKQAYSYKLLRHQIRYNRRHRLNQIKVLLSQHSTARLLVLTDARPDDWLASVERALASSPRLTV